MTDFTWFPLYTDKLLASAKVRRMDAREFGIYMALLVEEWKAGGPLEDDEEELAFLGRDDWERVERILQRCFIRTEGGWENDTIEAIRAEQEEKHQQRVEAGRKGGRSRPEAQTKRCSSDAQAPLKQSSSKGGQRERGEGREEKKREGAPKKKTKRKHSLPEDWKPNDTHQSIAKKESVDLAREAAKFADWTAANGRKYVDWDKAFCNWLRKAGDYRRDEKPETPPHPLHRRL